MGTFTLFVNNRPYCDGMKVPPLLFSTLRNYSRVHSYHIFFSFKKFCSLRILYTYIMKYEHIHLSFPSFQLSSKCHLNSIFFSSFFFFLKLIQVYSVLLICAWMWSHLLEGAYATYLRPHPQRLFL